MSNLPDITVSYSFFLLSLQYSAKMDAAFAVKAFLLHEGTCLWTFPLYRRYVFVDFPFVSAVRVCGLSLCIGGTCLWTFPLYRRYVFVDFPFVSAVSVCGLSLCIGGTCLWTFPLYRRHQSHLLFLFLKDWLLDRSKWT